MMTYSRPSSYYEHLSAPTLPRASNEQLPEQRYYGSSLSNSPRGSHPMSMHPRTLPYISIHRVSEPASPATIATTISSNSTPSPSPSRHRNMPNNISNSDFTLFDDSTIAAAAVQDFNNNVSKGHSTVDIASHYATSGFPIIVPHDANYGPSGLYGNYSSNYSAPESTSSNLYNANQQTQQSPISQSLSSQQKYLRPNSYNNGNDPTGTNSCGQSQVGEADVPALETVPALSPTSRQCTAASPVRGKQQRQPARPKSPHTPNGFDYAHSAMPMPKLSRTPTNVQDELYNPELINQNEGKVRQANSRKASPYHQPALKNERKTAFPHIFQEAQQQHQQDYTQTSNSVPHVSREHSPFRHNSPFHPTNATYGVSYGTDARVQQSQLPQVIDQSQLAMAMALREQMRKEAEQAVAPKTISPRDSLLEYHEPDHGHNQMSLFQPMQNGRIMSQQEEVLSNSSIHAASSHEGSDLGDFHSMATSRRESMANSSVSSHHLDIPRFSYMQQQQPSYGTTATTPYYYGDVHSLAHGLPVSGVASHIPYIKEEIEYIPIQRPVDTSANTGTYTCTYSGCGQRFTTSAKLQKHRREAHRKATPSGNSVSTAAAIASRNAQPGPHRCMRINPSTGKPCNTIFSRPYDLTRHEDTIHNSHKEKVRCEICNDEKTFSRPDALVRHRRVKHGIH